jgi:hypothetical protein
MTSPKTPLKPDKPGRGKYSRYTDYSSIPIPDPSKKPYPEWDAKERKAYELKLILSAGCSSRLCRTSLARQFSLSIPRITQDIKCLDKWIAQSVDAEKVHSWVLTTFQRAQKKLLEEGKEKQAFYMALDFSAYLQKLGIVHKVPEQLSVTGGLQIVFQTVEKQPGEAKEAEKDD